MFSNFRKRLEDSLDAVEALATGTTTQASPRLHRQDSNSSLAEVSSMTSPPVRHSSLDLASPSQHSPTFNYLPYQPRAAAQLADSAMSNLRRSLTLQRSASANSGPSEQERKASRASRDPGLGGSDRELSPIHAPTPRKTLGNSLEERLRANFAIGEASGSPSPAERLTPTAKAPDLLAETNSEKPVSTDPADVPLPMSPNEENLQLPNASLSEDIEPTSIHLPMSPPPHDQALLLAHENLVPPRNRSLSTSSVTHHPLSPPPPISNAEDTSESRHPTQTEPPAPITPPVQPSQIERSVPRPPNIIVDVSTPSSALVTPSDFATAESRSDITVGSPNASVDELSIDALQSSLLAVEAQATPVSAINELPPHPTMSFEPILAREVTEANVDPPVDVPETDTAAETEADIKLRDRLQVVEQRFSDISTSFKRLQAEKVAADKLIKEVSSLEGLSDLDGFRDYLLNQKMKIEISAEEIKRLAAQARQHDERLEEVREMHKMESSSQSDLVDRLRQQLAESEALLKVAESDTTAQNNRSSQLEAETERLKGALKDEEEKRTKAITLLKTVRQKLIKAEKERDDVTREREKDREDVSAARAEIERVRADADRAKKEREREFAAIRDRFEKETKESRERYEKELATRKGQYELDIITMKAAHAKESTAKTTRIASLESTITGLVNEKDALFEQCQTRQAEAESAQSHLQTVQNQVNELQYQLREAEERNSVLVDELDEFRNSSRMSTHSPTPGPEVARLLSEAEGRFESRLSDLRTKLRATEKERSEAEEDWNKTLADRGKEIEKLRFSLRQAEDKWLESGRVGKGMDEKVAALELKIQELHLQQNGWQLEKSALTDQLKQVQDTLQSLQTDHAETLERVGVFETQLEESKSREVYLRTSNKTLRDELRKVQSSAALLEKQRPGGVGGFWSGNNPSNASKSGNGVTSPLHSPRPSSPSMSDVGSASAKQEEEVNIEYIRNVILQFLEHKEMRPNLVRVLSTILRFTPQETRRLIAKV